MITKASLLNAVPIITFLLCAASPVFTRDNTSKPGACDFYMLRDGAVLRVGQSGAVKVDLEPDVRAICSTEDGLYFVRHDDGGFHAGFYSPDGSGNYEYPVLRGGGDISRFIVHDGIFYILLSGTGVHGGGGELIRFNPDSGRADSIMAVSDFGIAGGKVFVVRPREIVYGNASIPLMLEGKLSVKAVMDERLVLVTNGEETEVCDIVSGRNFYQYGEGPGCRDSDEFNLVLKFVDSGEGINEADPDGSMVYYNIMINGREDSRTETAPGRVCKTSFITLEPGKIYLVKAERWELDRTKGKYVRMNNIYQPREMRVFIPENRGVDIVVEFNGKEYNIKQGIYRGCGKREGGR